MLSSSFANPESVPIHFVPFSSIAIDSIRLLGNSEFDTLYVQPQETPEIDPSPAFVENFKSISRRYNLREKHNGTTGKRIQLSTE